MNFRLSKEQEIIQNTVRKLAIGVILPPGKKGTGGENPPGSMGWFS